MNEFLKRCFVWVNFRQNPWGSGIGVDLTWNDPQRDTGRYVTRCNIKPTEGRHTRDWWPTIPIHVSHSWWPEKAVLLNTPASSTWISKHPVGHSLDPRPFCPQEDNFTWKCLVGMPQFLNSANFILGFTTRSVRDYHKSSI